MTEAVLQLTASFVSLLPRVPALAVLPVGHGFTDFYAWCLFYNHKENLAEQDNSVLKYTYSIHPLALLAYVKMVN